MRLGAWFIASSLAGVWFAALWSCNVVHEGGDLTVVTVATSGSGSIGSVGSGDVGGAGGAGGDMGLGGFGGMDAVGSPASSTGAGPTTTSGGGGAVDPTGGGQGGSAELPVHGCYAKTAKDYTAQTNITLNYNTLTFPWCMKIRANAVITVNGNSQIGGTLYLGGLVDDSGIRYYDKTSPIQPNCFNANNQSPFDPNSTACYNGGKWPRTGASWKVGVYPWYNNSASSTQKGVIYVLP